MSDKPTPPVGHEDPHTLKRGLSQRHIQLIAIGGAIGTSIIACFALAISKTIS